MQDAPTTTATAAVVACDLSTSGMHGAPSRAPIPCSMGEESPPTSPTHLCGLLVAEQRLHEADAVLQGTRVEPQRSAELK